MSSQRDTKNDDSHNNNNDLNEDFLNDSNDNDAADAGAPISSDDDDDDGGSGIPIHKQWTINKAYDGEVSFQRLPLHQACLVPSSSSSLTSSSMTMTTSPPPKPPPKSFLSINCHTYWCIIGRNVEAIIPLSIPS